MRELQARIMAELDVRPVIDPAEEVEQRVSFLVDYLEATGAAGLVLGISGGQDSSLAGRLCQLAIERLAASGRTARFIAVRLPYSVQADEEDAQLALSFIRPAETVVFDIKRSVDGFQAEYEDATGTTITDFTKGNVKARSRMVAQFALAGLTKRQGKRLLQHLEAPERLFLKAPTADLLDENPGQTDEANLGLTYADIDSYLEGDDVADDVAESIEARFLATRHKRATPVTPSDTWWR
jgi:NAD+ synthase